MRRVLFVLWAVSALVSAPAFADTLTYDADVTEWDSSLGSVYPTEFRSGGWWQVNGNFVVLDTPDFQMGVRFSRFSRPFTTTPLENVGSTYFADPGVSYAYVDPTGFYPSVDYSTWFYDYHVDFKSGSLGDYDALEFATSISNRSVVWTPNVNIWPEIRLFQWSDSPNGYGSGVDPNADGTYFIELVLTQGSSKWSVRADIVVGDPAVPPSPVPEPSTLALVALVGSALYLRRRSTEKSQRSLRQCSVDRQDAI